MGKIVLIGCSSGGFEALTDLLAEIPATYAHPIVVASHSGPDSQLTEALKLKQQIAISIKQAEDGDRLTGQCVYVLPGATHGLVIGDTLRLSDLVRESGFRPSVDALFMTAAAEYRENTVAVVLSGTMSDGMRGAQVIYDMGGITIVQDPDEAQQASMPQSVIASDHPRQILKAAQLGAWLTQTE